jgi:hypothetical protein
MQYNLSYNPDRVEILRAFGRLAHCPQIAARAGIWWMDNARAVCFWKVLKFESRKWKVERGKFERGKFESF